MAASEYFYTAIPTNELKQRNPDGSTVWTNTNFTNIRVIEVDINGNVYAGDASLDLVRKLDSNGNILWTFTNHTNGIIDLDIDDNGNTYSVSQDQTVRKINSNGQQEWSFTGHTSVVAAVASGNNGNVYSSSYDSTLRKIDSNGNQVDVLSISSAFEGLYFGDDNYLYASGGSTVYKFDENLNQQWSFSLPVNGQSVVLGNDGFVYAATSNISGKSEIYKIDANTGSGSLFYTLTDNGRVDRDALDIDNDGNLYIGNFDAGTTEIVDSSGNRTFYEDIAGANIYAVAVKPALPEPPTYEVNLVNNYGPYTDFIYQDNDLTITDSSINTIIDNDEPFSVTTSDPTFGPFTFNFWYDLDNDEIFSNTFNINIIDPDRNYNLSANFTLDNSVLFNIDSNLPSPPNFELIVETVQNQTASIIQYPFSNEEIPLNYEYTLSAPTSNIGFYEFDYWYDNDNQEVYTNSAILNNTAIENLNLTATYSLPDEYQINLTLESDIGFITFQHGELDPITGESISVTIGEGDTWSATAPNNNDFQFNKWMDLDTMTDFSTSQTIGISNTSQNYNLRAFYFELVEIEWDSNGGTPIPNQKVIIGSSVNPPTDPVRPGFVFDGWENPLGQPQTFPTNISEDITFTAIWLETFTLTYDTNGGGRINPDTYIENAIPEVVTPSRFGYEFTGWFTDDGTFQNAYDFTSPITQDTTIHARWAFGSDRDAQLSLTTFLDDNDLGDGFSQIVIMITIYIFVNIVILIYQAPLIVTLILNFIVTSLFMILGWIAIWIVVVIFMALFGLLYFFSSGRGITE